MHIPVLRNRLARRQASIGIWITLESPSVTEIATVMGVDWVVIDAEHGLLDFKEIAEHLRVLKHTRTTGLVRIPALDGSYIKRVLDLGAEGILVPQIQTADEVRSAVRFSKYPPDGNRGVGAERATLWGLGIKSYARNANRRTLVIPMIEHVRAGENFEEILAVSGIDAVFFGMVDFAASAGELLNYDHPGRDEILLGLHRQAQSRGVPTGLLALDPLQVKDRQRQGFAMLGIAIDTQLIIQSLQSMIEASGRNLHPKTWHA